jgi:hypothetical protein
VTVVAEVSFKSSPKKLILLTKILIGKNYFSGDFDGVPFEWQTLTCTRAKNVLHIGGFNENPDQSQHIMLNGVDFGNPTRSYTFGTNAGISTIHSTPVSQFAVFQQFAAVAAR